MPMALHLNYLLTMKKFKDKVVWITGASSGIGEALVYALSDAGAKLIISARNQDELYRVKMNCTKNIINIHVLTLDLAQHDAIQQKTEAALNIYGYVDFIFHNGGISQRAKAVDTSWEVDKQLMDVNYFGAIYLTKAILPNMIARQSGHIVVVSSLVGKFGTPLRSGYSASKHALHGFFDSFRAEVFEDNIHVTIICPGFIKTNLTYSALLGDGSKQNKMDKAQEQGMLPETFAKKALNAVSKKKLEVYIGKKETLVVQIKRFLPGYFAKFIRKVKVT